MKCLKWNTYKYLNKIVILSHDVYNVSLHGHPVIFFCFGWWLFKMCGMWTSVTLQS